MENNGLGKLLFMLMILIFIGVMSLIIVNSQNRETDYLLSRADYLISRSEASIERWNNRGR